ncbi:group III truncated hemoglobin [Novosphingobium sp. BL-8A]|uniref:group III truncated hemoglobin n=1 Tax=Novosphingobium sp. BL-8A TaxID=3127639 RepID=UPI0037565A1C
MAVSRDDHLPTEAELARLVPAFYARVRSDPMLAPVFNAAVDDWDQHLERLVSFWSSVLLSSGKYKGNPVAIHGALEPKITPEMFDRWLELWDETTDALLPRLHACALQRKARLIAESLKLSLYFRLP